MNEIKKKAGDSIENSNTPTSNSIINKNVTSSNYSHIKYIHKLVELNGEGENRVQESGGEMGGDLFTLLHTHPHIDIHCKKLQE